MSEDYATIHEMDLCFDPMKQILHYVQYHLRVNITFFQHGVVDFVYRITVIRRMKMGTIGNRFLCWCLKYAPIAKLF